METFYLSKLLLKLLMCKLFCQTYDILNSIYDRKSNEIVGWENFEDPCLSN